MLPSPSWSSTRLRSSCMNGSSRPAWMPNWRPWRIWPTRPGTSPSPRSSSIWTASRCSLRWWRVAQSKSTFYLLLIYCSRNVVLKMQKQNFMEEMLPSRVFVVAFEKKCCYFSVSGVALHALIGSFKKQYIYIYIYASNQCALCSIFSLLSTPCPTEEAN